LYKLFFISSMQTGSYYHSNNNNKFLSYFLACVRVTSNPLIHKIECTLSSEPQDWGETYPNTPHNFVWRLQPWTTSLHLYQNIIYL